MPETTVYGKYADDIGSRDGRAGHDPSSHRMTFQ